MKKIVLTVAAVMSMTMAFAAGENDNNNTTTNANAYKFNVSTYAPIVSTLTERKYVAREKKALKPVYSIYDANLHAVRLCL